MDNGYFIMLRFRNTGWMGPVTFEGNDGETAYLFPTEEDAQKWIDESSIVRSGQVAAGIYEAPE